MKGKIITFIIGLLIGALLATGGYYLYEKNVKDNNANNTVNTTQNNRPGDGRMPEMPNGDSNTPPAKPDGDNGSTPPQMPQGDSNGVDPTAPSTDNNQTDSNTSNT